MKKMILIVAVFVYITASGQPDTTRFLRAFPITDYIVELNDSVKLVQVQLPDELSFSEKQLGLVRGVYNESHSDTVQKGYGRCQLIKGNYFYFAISQNKSGVPPKAGDLLYTFMEGNPVYYGRVPKLASHFIRLQNIHETAFYDRFNVFLSWTAEEEGHLLDSMVADIRFTGNYFLENEPSRDQVIPSGNFRGQHLFSVMKDCKVEYLENFIDYILVRPRLYAGKEWKLSEIFATWLVNGSPTVVRG